MQSFPRWIYPRTSTNILDGIDTFLSNQMDQFTPFGPRYVQTYRYPKGHDIPQEQLYRGDTYDTAITTIYFLERGNFSRASALADALYLAIMHDSNGEGRIATAIDSRNLFSAELEYCTNVLFSEADSTSTGSVAWAGLALARAYHYLKTSTYLEGAILAGNWIISRLKFEDVIKGFAGGEEWGEARKWRSVEHNAQVYALFRMLSSITQDHKWESNTEHARDFVNYCFDITEGLYNTGVGAGNELEQVYPADAQLVPVLTDIEPAQNTGVLRALVTRFFTNADNFEGIRFSAQGTGMQNEKTAAAAFALHISGEKEFKSYADRLYESLERQIGSAPHTDKRGLVAASKESDTAMGWSYGAWLHCASTAWAGIAFLGKNKPSANPFHLPI
eukprot:Phypoly_transcript_09414.p1 GENE.Phypoly_transcript_09414~~Phypoly_transcript_09414.p1  ORF type:complete len:390 (+),score=32.96 Phypoly_transcript_09414:120-1289(+)